MTQDCGPDVGRYAVCLKGVPIPARVVGAVARHSLRRGIVKQCGSADVVADLAGGHEEAEQSTFFIGDGVRLRIHTAFDATDEASKAPF